VDEDLAILFAEMRGAASLAEHLTGAGSSATAEGVPATDHPAAGRPVAVLAATAAVPGFEPCDLSEGAILAWLASKSEAFRYAVRTVSRTEGWTIDDVPPAPSDFARLCDATAAHPDRALDLVGRPAAIDRIRVGAAYMRVDRRLAMLAWTLATAELAQRTRGRRADLPGFAGPADAVDRQTLAGVAALMLWGHGGSGAAGNSLPPIAGEVIASTVRKFRMYGLLGEILAPERMRSVLHALEIEEEGDAHA
jgi:hypothetical protein